MVDKIGQRGLQVCFDRFAQLVFLLNFSMSLISASTAPAS